ncbi:MAG: BatB protein [Legionellales bacterium]|nr:BatB protein [Legionellales bacterium]|tara:strand:+ start:7331 stop:8365 length:1035 start_codon:yes stop_codon:yes gene_type:complete
MLQFAALWVLCLLPLPLIVRYLIPAAAPRETTALKVPFYQRLQQYRSRGETGGNVSVVQQILLFTAWVLLLLALAGPQWLGEPIRLPRNGRDVMLAVDLSGSMQIPDMNIGRHRVNRLQAIKAVASQFIDHREGDRVGLIVFGSKAYLQTPLTFDRKTATTMLNDTSIGLAGQQTAIGDAIGLGVKRLMHNPEQARVMILLTDGANNRGNVSPIEAAKLAAKESIKIYTIGFGAEHLTIPGVLGAQTINPSADLDVDTLQQIAQLTGGEFFRAKDTASLVQVYQAIDKLEPVSRDETLFRPTKPLYPWPLAASLLLSLYFALRLMPEWHVRLFSFKRHKSGVHS